MTHEEFKRLKDKDLIGYVCRKQDKIVIKTKERLISDFNYPFQSPISKIMEIAEFTNGEKLELTIRKAGDLENE